MYEEAHCKCHVLGAKIGPLLLPSLYYLNLEDISVEGSRLDIPATTFKLRHDGNGRIFINLSTTITFLKEATYR
ncbi:hypothetical protein SUGI_0312000 [Cryptomeria japonica]|nr:hypothetical protein SUGI_0312000 [Cryptomeria japonica]